MTRLDRQIQSAAAALAERFDALRGQLPGVSPGDVLRADADFARELGIRQTAREQRPQRRDLPGFAVERLAAERGDVRQPAFVEADHARAARHPFEKRLAEAFEER